MILPLPQMQHHVTSQNWPRLIFVLTSDKSMQENCTGLEILRMCKNQMAECIEGKHPPLLQNSNKLESVSMGAKLEDSLGSKQGHTKNIQQSCN